MRCNVQLKALATCIMFLTASEINCFYHFMWLSFDKSVLLDRVSIRIFPQAPREVLLLAAECNLMRWRTAKGMVDEKRWDEFVQYVRRGMEKVGIRSNKEAWPDMKWFQAARELEYHRLDY